MKYKKIIFPNFLLFIFLRNQTGHNLNKSPSSCDIFWGCARNLEFPQMVGSKSPANIHKQRK